ncbi:MAG: aspartate-semialdehyde dehydrogenase [Armatimonadota bacterium]
MSDKISVGVLGATGTVGQMFINLLRDHPWFEVKEIAASDRSRGSVYSALMNDRWKMTSLIPAGIEGMIVKGCDDDLSSKILFSGLDSSVAGEIEEFYAQKGHIVISNSRNHRMGEHVPLLVPEVNHDHTGLLKYQNRRGKIVTNPNCSTVGMVLALAPIEKKFGIDKIIVTTMQALSGAGYPGVPSMDILDNLIPYISGEEPKMETETLKLFGKLEDGKIKFADIKISASCNRVAITDGHTECISFSLKNKASIEDLKNEIKQFNPLKDMKLPSAPNPPVIITEQENRPQPRYDRNRSNGMSAVMGRLRECPVLGYKMTILSHNTIRGAAGCAILNAELLKAKGLI